MNADVRIPTKSNANSNRCGDDAALKDCEDEDDGWFVNSEKWVDANLLFHAVSAGGMDWFEGRHLRGALEYLGGVTILDEIIGVVVEVAGLAVKGGISLVNGIIALGAKKEASTGLEIVYKGGAEWTAAQRAAAEERPPH